VRRRRPVWVAVAGCVAAVYGAAMLVERRREPHPILQALPSARPAVVAHRGGSGIRPENTLLAFRHAVDLGVDMLEMDLWATRDDVPVVLHDGTVDRTTDGTGHVIDMELEDVRTLDAAYRWTPPGQEATFPHRGTGVRIPTLEEVFEAVPGIPITLEIKQTRPSMVHAVGSLIRRFDRAPRTLVASFDAAVLRELRARFPEVATSASRRETIAFEALHRLRLDALYRPPFDALQVPEQTGALRVVTPRYVRRAHAKNLPVQVWTVNDPADMRRLVAMGVDALITDRPDLAMEVVGAGR
jgi:glycerophosphoryl diester phosphodiesterase